MIRDPATGDPWGTAREVAHELGLDRQSGPELVRSWARRGRITRKLVAGPGRGTVYYNLAEAIEEERRSRRAGTGRPRA